MDKNDPMNPLHRQVGGRHYSMHAIQPVEFITNNYLNFLEGCVVKRICRWRHDGGKGIEDLEKAVHEIELLSHMTADMETQGRSINEEFRRDQVEKVGRDEK